MTVTRDTTLNLLIAAASIPDGASVSRPHGSKVSTLRVGLVVYPAPKTDAKSFTVEGLFLVDTGGNINQVTPETQLRWYVSARELIAQIVRDEEREMMEDNR